MSSTNTNATPAIASSTGKSKASVTVLTAAEVVVLKAKDIGLSTTKQCSTAKALATGIASLVCDRFAMSDSQEKSLLKDLIQCFSHAGVTNDEIFAFMFAASS